MIRTPVLNEDVVLSWKHAVLFPLQPLSMENPDGVQCALVAMHAVCYHLGYDGPPVEANLRSVGLVDTFQLLLEKTG